MVQTRSMTAANQAINIRLGCKQAESAAVPDPSIYPSLGKFFNNPFLQSKICKFNFVSIGYLEKR